MGFLEAITPWRGRKGAATNAMVVYGQGQPVHKTAGHRGYIREGYIGNTDVHACVQQITGAAKGIRVELFRVSRRAQARGVTQASVQKQLRQAAVLKGGYRGRQREVKILVRKQVLEPVENHPVLDLLAQPNPMQDWTELLEAWLGSYLVTGNGILHAVAARDLAPPTELETLRPDKFDIIKGNREFPIARYEYGEAGNKDRIEATEVLHVKTWNPDDDWWGLSPLAAAAKAIDWQNAADDWNLSLMQNGGQKAGAIKVDTTLLPDQRADLQAWVDDEFSAKDKRGRPLLLEGGMDWRDLGLTPMEAAWLEGQRHARRRVCSVYKVAPELLGDSENKTYSNYREAKAGLYTEATLPALDTFFSKLNGWLLPRYGDDLVLAYDADDIEVLHEERDKLWARIEAASDLTVDEKRVAKGYPELEGGIGDVILVPLTLVPLGMQAAPAGDDSAATGDVQAGAGVALTRKAIGLRTYDAKTEWWKAMERQRGQALPVALGIIERTLSAERKAVVTAIREASTEVAASIAAERALGEGQARWHKALRQLYVGIGGTFAEAVAGQLAKSVGDPEVRKAADWERIVTGYLQQRAGTAVKNITSTTLTQLRSELATGIAEGEGTDAIAKRIDGLYLEKIIPYRSQVIARTETIRASNLGSRAGAVSTGLPLEKEWVSTRDGRERDAHSEADGQRTGMDTGYTVDGEELLFPGDDSLGASAGNLIQCRCTEVYAVAGE